MERINGETIAGLALSGLAILFILAATMNSAWAIILPADYLILAIGIAFIVLGVWTMKKSRSSLHSGPSSHNTHSHY